MGNHFPDHFAARGRARADQCLAARQAHFALFLLAFLALVGFAYLVGEAMAGSAVVTAAAAPVSA
jgi:hypothetical protein